MYKVIIAALSLSLLVACGEEKAKGNLEITGNIKGFKKGKLYIQKVQDTTLIALDTIVLNGESSFKSIINIDSPEMLYLFVDRGVTNSLDNNLLFFAEPGKINIDTDLEFFLGNAKITGSKNNDLYTDYKGIISKFNEQQLEYVKDELMALKNKKDISAENAKKQETLLKKRYLYAANYALTHADKEVAPYIALTDIYDMNIKYLDTIQKSMSPEVAKSKYGQKFTQFLKERKENETTTSKK
ncbi:MULTISPECIES: DUF4369 domain-containing protein [Flavobacterium]|uniref:DUF4369 domain-containing protein n=1 Tax=Flavobacterium hankyongi TaxID=1176532 RepID=A0ABP9A5M3_9FLAO|nr:DUF4369 domain-containing protein [Flavobacterium sp. N1846]